MGRGLIQYVKARIWYDKIIWRCARRFHRRDALKRLFEALDIDTKVEGRPSRIGLPS